MTLPSLPITIPGGMNSQQLWRYIAQLRQSLEYRQTQDLHVNDIGALGITPIGPLTGVTLPAATSTPATPTGLQAFGFYKQVVLVWSLDTDPTIEGWEIQRATNAGFTTGVTTLTVVRALAYLDDDNLSDSTQYHYRIRAKGDGNDNYSSYTSVVNATTLSNDSTVLTQLASAAQLIQTAHILSAVIGTAQIANLSVTDAKIANLAVTTAKIALLAVTDAQIADLAVTTAKINDLAVTTAKIANLAVTDAKIDSLTADKITAGTIDVLVSLTNNSIKLDGANSLISITDTQGSPRLRVELGKLGVASNAWGLKVYDASGNVMWDTTSQGATSVGIKDLAVITDKLAALATTTEKIAANAVSNPSKVDVTTAFLTTNSSPQGVTGAQVVVNTTGNGPVLVTLSTTMTLDCIGGGGFHDIGGVVTLLRDSTPLTASAFFLADRTTAFLAATPCNLSFVDDGVIGSPDTVAYGLTLQTTGTPGSTEAGLGVTSFYPIHLQAVELKK